jgi:hypothetical protein
VNIAILKRPHVIYVVDSLIPGVRSNPCSPSLATKFAVDCGWILRTSTGANGLRDAFSSTG